ncbi:MAG: 4-(cytidine 5'-diphospho)-2-C-methyl-D-erythritol kinase [Rhodospirillaceae bacterium TMED8]|nr:4-(cytidine 5'-diphospho)-2-C-methyl-D-erythritol kinase [Magnetovibrio sp.]OUT53193.1 MAG: 4-(cytidine 5'-diphospho)-2-C-methyl-D-erythritol kinase [Rhodospirillaceae bacterium TMED8]
MKNTFKQFAPAKINLYLHITGRRDNGYHELDSLVVFAEIGDMLRVEPSSTLSLEVTGPFARDISVDHDNLVLRAAKWLLDKLGNPVGLGAAMHLEKNLPVSSGLGGGSADAAATIKTLACLWGGPLAQTDTSSLALGLGADVPVCMAGVPAVMRGIGEVLLPIDKVPALSAVLVNPGISVSTPAVFKERDNVFSGFFNIGDPAGDAIALISALRKSRNHLTKSAMLLAPEISATLSAISATSDCLLVRMSGSGATCFGLYGSNEAAACAARELRANRPDWWVESTVFQGNA